MSNMFFLWLWTDFRKWTRILCTNNYSDWFIFDCIIQEIIGWHFWDMVYMWVLDIGGAT